MIKDDQIFDVTKNIIQFIDDNGVENNNYSVVDISKVMIDRNVNTQDSDLLKKYEGTIKEFVNRKNEIFEDTDNFLKLLYT